MYPPVYSLVKDDAAVRAALGNPARVHPFGQTPEQTVVPYAVWQVAYGSPENYLNDVPNTDSFGLQMDVYAKTVDEVRNCALALRNALEPHAHVVSWRGETKESGPGQSAGTKLYRLSFDIEFWTPR